MDCRPTGDWQVGRWLTYNQLKHDPVFLGLMGGWRREGEGGGGWCGKEGEARGGRGKQGEQGEGRGKAFVFFPSVTKIWSNRFCKRGIEKWTRIQIEINYATGKKGREKLVKIGKAERREQRRASKKQQLEQQPSSNNATPKSGQQEREKGEIQSGWTGERLN